MSNLILTRGDDRSLDLTAKRRWQTGDGAPDADGNVVLDLSGAEELWFTARRRYTKDIVLSKTKTGGGISFVTDGTDGLAVIEIDAADWDNFPTGYAEGVVYDVQALLPVGVKTLVKGRITIEEDVTTVRGRNPSGTASLSLTSTVTASGIKA